MRLSVPPPLALPNNLQTQQTNVGSMQYTTQMNIIENFDQQIGQIIQETFLSYLCSFWVKTSLYKTVFLSLLILKDHKKAWSTKKISIVTLSQSALPSKSLEYVF